MELPQPRNFGAFSAPTFDADGTRLAVFDTGSKQIRILLATNLTPVATLQADHRPRRMSFSPEGRYLVSETIERWLDDFIDGRRTSGGHVEIESPEAIRDAIQRAEIFDLQTGTLVAELHCDAVTNSLPQGGWLWASQWAIVPGYQRSAILEAHFSADDSEFSMLCWNGVSQRWDSRTWKRLDDLPPPAIWNPLMGISTARWIPEDPSVRPPGGKTALLHAGEEDMDLATLKIWNREVSQSHQLSGECALGTPPAYGLSRNLARIAIVCRQGIGLSAKVWDLPSAHEVPLDMGDFSFAGGLPTILDEGVMLSPDGRYLAIAVIEKMAYLFPNILMIPAGIWHSDLHLWNIDTREGPLIVSLDDLDPGAVYIKGIDLAFSPDGTMLAVAGRKLRLYRMSDLIPGNPQTPTPGGGIRGRRPY